MMPAGASVFCYLAFTPLEGSDKRLTTSHLRDMGCKRFNNLFWRVPLHRLEEVLSYKELKDPVVLKRTRNLVQQAIDCDGDIVELSSFVVIAYKAEMPSKKTRKIIQRALQRAPYFKLCPSVYAFPQPRKPKSSEYNTKAHRHGKRQRITTPGEFFDILNGLDCKVVALPRMVVMNSTMCGILVERMKTTRRIQCRKLIQTCKNIETSIRLQSEYVSSRPLKLRLSEVKYRYKAIRGVLSFFKRQMNIDMSKELVKTSKAIGSCIRTLRQTEEMKTAVVVKSVN